MKDLLHATCTLVLAGAAVIDCAAQPLEIERLPLGSGEPGQAGFENAVPVGIDENVYHVPQYLPGFPTAATLWPRIIQVRCRRTTALLRCDGYQWVPALGRAEYLYFVPVVEPPGPQ